MCVKLIRRELGRGKREREGELSDRKREKKLFVGELHKEKL